MEFSKCYEFYWDFIIEAYCKLLVSSGFSFDRVSFILVDTYLLDMIDKFAGESR